MKGMILAFLAVVGLMGCAAAPGQQGAEAGKKNCCTREYVKVGKVTEARMVCEMAMPEKAASTRIIEVPAAERQPGDFIGAKMVGKHLEWVVYREVPAEPAAAPKASGHECFYGFVKQGKQTDRRMMCEVNGQQVSCGGMTPDGKCEAR